MELSEEARQKPWKLQNEAVSHGFLPGLNDIQKLSRTKTAIESFLRSLRVGNDYIPDIEKHCPEAIELLPEVLNISGAEIDARHCLKRVELHIRRSGGASIPAHQDNFYHCIQSGRGAKVLVPLGELNSKNGGLTFLDVRVDQKLLEHMPSKIRNFSATISPQALAKAATSQTSYSYKAGDASYHWLNSVHWAKANSTKQDAIFLVYRLEEPGSVLDESLKARYEICYEQHLSLIDQLDK